MKTQEATVPSVDAHANTNF